MVLSQTMINLYKDWWPARKAFNRPRLHCWMGKWRNNPCLPVWRRGNTINIGKFKINLPILLSFYVFSHPMIWKPKWDELRYEFPPQITFVFFGLSISFWTEAPIDKSDTTQIEDNYWESILYYNKYKDLQKVIEKVGIWNTKIQGRTIDFYGVHSEFLKERKLDEYYKIIKNLDYDRKA